MNAEEPALDAILGPLVSACSSGDIDRVESLLAKWNPSSKTLPEYKLRPALWVAASQNQLRAAILLLERGFQIDSRAILAAVKARSIAALETFLSYGWDINDRWYPFMMPGIW